MLICVSVDRKCENKYKSNFRAFPNESIGFCLPKDISVDSSPEDGLAEELWHSMFLENGRRGGASRKREA